MSWFYLFLAIFLEVAGTTSMKLSEGMSKPIPTIAMFVLYFFSFSSLSLALKQLEVGTAYAIWSGLGTAAIALIGVYLFKDSFSLLKGVAILLIILGCVLLNLDSGGEKAGAPLATNSSEAGNQSGVS
ncbi:multidrug efflux SMR transporter [Brevibacillus composti]|uniref:Multidrug efflux SMR transporter n=1 Tax=Brevibacillus composti TaxID=2796470 RepID=A0A7T5JNF0_9BACL|nr:multidrug efflux SMR transporter [Brevibacillus composti]QQE73950.1 multidrug efflux SMR transporter [Brevibacillus composti]QUO41034.1 multidrug efflux SMR transporter [Brevibacillus composti]